MLRHLWWILGLALVGGGLALVLFARVGTADFGWVAYTPQSDQPDWYTAWGDASSGSAVVLSRGQLVGSASMAAGLAVIASGLGFLVGRRRVTRPELPVRPPGSPG